MLDIAFAKAVLPKTGVLVLPLAEGAALEGMAATLDEALGGGLTRALEAAQFTGKKGQSATGQAGDGGAGGGGAGRRRRGGVGKGNGCEPAGGRDGPDSGGAYRARCAAAQLPV